MRRVLVRRFDTGRSGQTAAALSSVPSKIGSRKALPATSSLKRGPGPIERLVRAGVDFRPIPRQGLLPAAKAATLIGLTPQDMRKSIDERRFFAFLRGGVEMVPAFFADCSIDRGALERTSVALGDLPSDSKWQFFTQPSGEFDGASALDALRAGQVELVLIHARYFRDAP